MSPKIRILVVFDEFTIDWIGRDFVRWKAKLAGFLDYLLKRIVSVYPPICLGTCHLLPIMITRWSNHTGRFENTIVFTGKLPTHVNKIRYIYIIIFYFYQLMNINLAYLQGCNFERTTNVINSTQDCSMLIICCINCYYTLVLEFLFFIIRIDRLTTRLLGSNAVNQAAENPD
ncbi:hypothetical protein ACJX0J_032483 [Zea mays]